METGSAERSSGSPEAPRRGPAADRRVAGLARVPPLGLLAVGAALFELVLARAIWHGGSQVLDAGELIELRRLARFPRNLAAVAGLGALVTALFAFLRLPGFASIGRRLAVAAFSGVFVPSIVVAAALPAAMLQPKLVVFGLASAHVLVALLALTAVRHRADPPVRAAVALAGLAAFATLLFVGLGQLANAQGGFWRAVGAALGGATGEGWLMGIRHAGELAWLGVLVAGTVAVAWDRNRPGLRPRVALVVGAAVALTAGLAALASLAGLGVRFFLIGGFRLDLFVDALPIAYAAPLGVGLAGALVGIARSEPSTQQLGAALLAWLAAGFGPHTPIQLLYLVLGAAMLARAAQARDSDDRWRSRQPWARFFAPAVPRPSDPSAGKPEPVGDLGEGRPAE